MRLTRGTGWFLALSRTIENFAVAHQLWLKHAEDGAQIGVIGVADCFLTRGQKPEVLEMFRTPNH